MPKTDVRPLGGLSNKIYYIRNQQVMLDYDLAEIYGYTTSAFNQQVARNIEKFKGEDFMFQMTRNEIDDLVISQNVISRPQTLFKGQGGGSRKLPYAFTEQGIYMLMTILHGELAVKQSRALIRMFKSMKDYIINSQSTLDYRNNLKILTQLTENTKDIAIVREELTKVENEVYSISNKIKETVLRSEISPIMLDFGKIVEQKELLILDGEPARASEAYLDIYSKATKTVFIIDNYINIKSLRLLQSVSSGVEVTFFSDNIGNYLHQNDYDDFKKEFPQIEISFIRTSNKVHDRFIILDYNTKTEKIYQCGASS